MTDELKEACKRGEEGALELYADWLKERGDPLGDLITLMQDPGLVRRWSEVGKMWTLVSAYDRDLQVCGYTTEEAVRREWADGWPEDAIEVPCYNGFATRSYFTCKWVKSWNGPRELNKRALWGPEGESRIGVWYVSTRSIEHAMEFARKENA